MEINFRTTKADYQAFYTYYYFRRNLGWRIPVLVILGLWIGSFRSSDQPFYIGTYLVHSLIAIVVIALLYVVPYWAAVLRLIRQTRASGVSEKSFTITLNPDGFSVLSPGDEAKFWRWESIKTADSGRGYVSILLFQRRLYLIPRHFFLSENEADNFTGFIRNGVEKVRGNSEMSRQLRARRLRWWGLVGLIPNFGFIAGLILFFKGIFQFRDRWLVVIGVADVLFTVVFWFAFTRWEMNSSTFTDLHTEMSRDELTSLFKDIEFYKFQHGVYPDSLSQVAGPHGNVWINDPFLNGNAGKKAANFYYEKVGDRYWLFSVGADRQPFTKDDIFPQLEPADTSKFGLLLRR